MGCMLEALDLPENAGPLGYLAHGRAATEAAFGPPGADVDRHHLGTHPTVVDRLWGDLNQALPTDARWLVFDGPALVHPCGALLAAAIGTQYALRLLSGDRDAAIAAGAEGPHPLPDVGTTPDPASHVRPGA